MTPAELEAALSPLLDELQAILSELQLISYILAGVVLFMGFIFGAMFVRFLLERFK